MVTVRVCNDVKRGEVLAECECGYFRSLAGVCGMPDMVARAMRDLGAAIKRFCYGCVAGGGQTNAHGSYVFRDNRCPFCGEPVDKPPVRRAVFPCASDPGDPR